VSKTEAMNTDEVREEANKGLRGIEWYRPQLFAALGEIDGLKADLAQQEDYIFKTPRKEKAVEDIEKKITKLERDNTAFKKDYKGGTIKVVLDKKRQWLINQLEACRTEKQAVLLQAQTAIGLMKVELPNRFKEIEQRTKDAVWEKLKPELEKIAGAKHMVLLQQAIYSAEVTS